MTADSRPQILYVGAFRLPDQNAAAQRVLANAKGLRRLGYDVLLAETGQADGSGGPAVRIPDYDGFACWRLPMNERILFDRPQLAVRQITELLESLDSPVAVIAYNYPAVPLARLIRFCRRRKISCAADVTEWYGTGHLSSQPAKGVKWIDTTLRMRILHKRLDALVVISSYLEEFYGSRTRARVIKIPPLVDAHDEKWTSRGTRATPALLSLVYAGSASAEKERLDATVAAVVEAAHSIPIHLDVVGVTADEFTRLYPEAQEPSPEMVTFHGRVRHQEALARVSEADYSVIIRDRSRVTDAGFPTKLVESITLGTPVFGTPHPDVSLILADGRNGAVVHIENLAAEFIAQQSDSRQVDRELFDVRKYEENFADLAAALGLKA